MVGDFVCNVCGKQFIAKRALYLHMRGVHTEVEVPCNDCDKIFKSKTKLEYHTRATHQEKNSFYCDVKVGDTRCIYYSATKSNLRAHKKRMHEKTLLNWCVARVTTELTGNLIWTHTVRSAKFQIEVPSITLATCATRRFLQRSTWLGTKNCTTELTMLNLLVMFLVLCARRLSWTLGIWIGTQRKITGSQRLATLLKEQCGDGCIHNRSTC